VLFNSYIFLLVFLPLTLAGWWLLPGRRARLLFLTVASYVFYGWWDYRFVPLMILSTSADFLAGAAIARSTDRRHRTVWLVLLLVFNLGILAVFKYFDFFAGTLNGIGRALGFAVDLAADASRAAGRNLVLHLQLDQLHHRCLPGETAASQEFLEFSSFVAMFPHLVAGPIVRYADMGHQFENLERSPDSGEWVTGLWLLVIGMAKKVLVADVLAGGLVDPLWQQAMHLDTGEAWLATLGYTLQIYFDFSGYSDMAVGLAFLLGFKFPRTSIRLTSRGTWPNSGAAGTCPSPTGCGTISTSRLEDPTEALADGAQSGRHDVSRRPLARRRLDICGLGSVPRRIARRSRATAAPWIRAALAGTGEARHFPRCHDRLGLLPVAITGRSGKHARPR
jgi:hypothetical protein